MKNELTQGMRYRLTKDFQLPITLFDEKNYYYFRDLYDGFFKISEKEAQMQNVLNAIYQEKVSEDLNTEMDKEATYFNYAATTNNKLKEIIKGSNAYKLMNEATFAKFEDNAEKRNIYIEENYGKRLISVDLNKANFNVFNLYGLNEELKITGYADFVKLATPYEYFVNSRMTRQVVFGDLNPKRQQNIQSRIINQFAKLLKAEGLTLTSSSSDEIIIDPNGSNDVTMNLVSEILSNVSQELKFFRVEEFCFNKVVPQSDKSHFFKTSVDSDGNVKESFKSVPNLFFAQVFKQKFALPLEERDMMFFHEGKLARFLEPIYNELENTVEKRIKPR